MIVGIDEVGRGAWAGPLVVGAVLLGSESIEGLTDSKLLSKKARERLDIEIRQKAVGVGIGWVSAKVIDRIGLSEALKLASRKALECIKNEYREIIIDGTIALIDDPRVTLMKKADLLIPSVSAASIVAKVARDNYMKYLDDVFPGYEFSAHVGYGTAMHRGAIEELGVTPIHRLSFAPLKKYSVVDVSANEGARGISAHVTSKQIGSRGEDTAARYLWQLGHNVIDRNWRTKFCEIDIVSQFGDAVYFTQVKYHKNDKAGGGLAAVTPKKQQQMKFAAEYYALKNNLKNTNLRLAVVHASGDPPKVNTFLELG
ncbi:MAG TPA: ribonuclease HII [Candidatus Saccharimonadales bacterium]|nr:ribonuclease HII [Candidatus Saccharimonadales bacterium]